MTREAALRALRVRTPRLELRLPDRAELLELAYRGLGFEVVTSGAFVDNPQSQRVSERLGYRRVGTATHAPRGEPVDEILYRLERSDWRCPVEVELVGADAVAPFMSRSSATP